MAGDEDDRHIGPLGELLLQLETGSIPGYGFSAKPMTTGWNFDRIARLGRDNEAPGLLIDHLRRSDTISSDDQFRSVHKLLTTKRIAEQ